jgi:hypothetical protein
VVAWVIQAQQDVHLDLVTLKVFIIPNVESIVHLIGLANVINYYCFSFISINKS